MAHGCEVARRRKAARFGAGAILAAAAMTAGAGMAGEPMALSFDGATLGMSIADWKSLAPPAGVGLDAAPICASVTQAREPPSRAIAASLPPADTQACGYDARIGHDLLPRTVPLDQRYRATGVRYLFVGGRLEEIDLAASIDAFNDVMAMLEQKYGPPTQTARDWTHTSMGRVARVRQTWRTAAGVVTLVDPAADPVQLTVRFGAGPPG